MVDVDDLIGTFVVEYGARQAWSFLTLADNKATPEVERRLYIESGIEVRPTRAISPGDAIATQVQALSALIGLTVTSATVDDDNSLRLTFTDGGLLVVDGVADEETSIEPWWIT